MKMLSKFCNHQMTHHKTNLHNPQQAAIKSGLMTVIPAHADASKINDHPILSPTFREEITKKLGGFIDQYDCR